jgi:hypothetical protein
MALISYWKMDEGSGLTLNDSVGSDIATIDTGASVVWTANAIKSGVTSPVFTGTGYGLAANVTPANFDGTTPFSVFVWLSGAPNANQSIINNQNVGGGIYQGWELAIDHSPIGGSRLAALILHDNSVGNGIAVHSAEGVGGGFVGFTYDGSGLNTGIKMYQNAVLLTNQVDISGPLTASAASGVPVRFGGRNDGTNLLSAALGYAQIYDVALTSTQVSALFALGPGGILISAQPIQNFILY